MSDNCTRKMIQFTFTANSKLFLSFVLLLLTLALARLDNPTDIRSYNCSADQIKNGSALETNLNLVLISLVENVHKTGYNISWHGEDGDKMYGLAQCRGDLNASTCGDCTSSAQFNLIKICRGSSSGSINLEGCFLRYATHIFYSQFSNTTSGLQCGNITDANRTDAHASGLNLGLENLLLRVGEKAVSSNVRYGTLHEQRFYTLAQCWRDLSVHQCDQCLATVIKGLLACSITLGFTQNCMMRYDVYQFYGDALPSGSGPPIPPSTGPSIPPSRVINKGKGRLNLGLILGMTIAGVVIVLLLGVFVIRKRKVIQHFLKNPLPGHSKLSSELSSAISKSKINYKYSILRTATKTFNPANKIGQGGFGAVYKGILPNGSEIAVKRLNTNEEQSVSDFFNEVNLISNVQHRNLAKLLGCSVDGRDRLLIYEYLPNKSLDLFLFDENLGKLLDWQRRFEIILGTAGGLAYLHHESDIRIIHRDIKANNILLDQHLKPKIADFGLVRYFAEDQTHLNTTIIGTRGYMAPEYLVHGHLTEKVDIYAFGVLVLEIISGRKNEIPMYVNDMPSLLTVVWNNYLSGTLSNVIDRTIKNNCKEEVLQVVHIALLCTQATARLRPSMSEVIMFLTSKNPDLPTPTQPPFVDVDYSTSSAITNAASASGTCNPLSNIASPSATSTSLNTISTSSFGAR